MAEQKWELLMNRVDELVSMSKGTLYERVGLLLQVEADPLFLSYHDGVYDKAEAHLDQKLGDYGFSFAEAKLMIQKFASRLEWEQGNLANMCAQSLAEEQAKRKEVAPRRKIERVTRQEHKVVVQERERLQGQVSRMKSEGAMQQGRTDDLVSENRRLRGEILQLKEELARSEGRIEELEKLVSREPAVA